MNKTITAVIQNHLQAPRDFASFTVRDGVKLYYQKVESVSETKGILISLQGINGGGLKGELNERLAEKGVASYIIHQRGTGYSEGISGDIDSFETILKDYQEFIELIRKKHPNKPLVLLGHSIGGTFCLRLAEEPGGDSLNGIVLINPATKFREQKVISFGRRVRFILNYVFRPHALVINAVHDQIDCIEDRRAVEERLQDRLSLKMMSPCYAVASVELMKEAVKKVKTANTPLLLILGGNDNVIDRRVTEVVFNHWKNPCKAMKVFPDDGHGGNIFGDSTEVIIHWMESVAT